MGANESHQNLSQQERSATAPASSLTLFHRLRLRRCDSFVSRLHTLSKERAGLVLALAERTNSAMTLADASREYTVVFRRSALSFLQRWKQKTLLKQEHLKAINLVPKKFHQRTVSLYTLSKTFDNSPVKRLRGEQLVYDNNNAFAGRSPRLHNVLFQRFAKSLESTPSGNESRTFRWCK